MTASEFAFLALGLVLGVASGSAIVVVLGSRPPAREVKLTVEHGAVPRRAATLSSDAFTTAPGEPARGGPADRRRFDRDAPTSDPPAPRPSFGVPGIAVMGALGGGGAAAMGGPIPGLPMRTIVPSDRPRAGVVPIVPERDPSLDALRIQAVLAAEHAKHAGRPTASALLEAPPSAADAQAPGTPEAATTRGAAGTAASAIDATPAVIRILRGDQRALLRTVQLLAGADDAMRRPWQAAVSGFAEAIVHRAVERGVLDFPVGDPFWDTFTVDQCRAIAEGLAAIGFRFDGIDGWADERIPSHRDLTAAVAAAGLEPRRIRAWPTQDEIGALYRHVTVAADDHLAAHAPELDLAGVQDLLGSRAEGLELLFRDWPTTRAVLGEPLPGEG